MRVARAHHHDRLCTTAFVSVASRLTKADKTGFIEEEELVIEMAGDDVSKTPRSIANLLEHTAELVRLP